MNNSRIVKGKNVEKYLDRAFKNGWKIAKRIDFENDEYNYHLVPENESDGYICMWCKGKEFEAQYYAEKYHDDNYKEFANEYWKGYYSVSAENVENNMVTVIAKHRKCSLPEWSFDFVEIGATYVKMDRDSLNPTRGKTWGRVLNVSQLEEV